jgi:hypothetical protein
MGVYAVNAKKLIPLVLGIFAALSICGCSSVKSYDSSYNNEKSSVSADSDISSVEPMTDADNSSSESDENSVVSENSSSEIEEISTAYDESSSAELITDAETIKSLIDDCIEENGFKLGVGVEIQDSKNWLPDEPDHEIVIVGLSVDYNRRSEIENWDEYLGEINDKVLECISDNNIDENYVIVYLYE